MDIEAFIKARRKLNRAGNSGVWVDAVSNTTSTLSSTFKSAGRASNTNQAELNSVGWFGRHKNQFKNSEDTGDMETGQKVFFASRSP